jgi:cbb3-type cytochrome oxidase subunit 1
MPKLSVWLVRSALVSLGLGFLIGAGLLSGPALGLYPQLAPLRPLHIELLITGWLVQLAFGVGYWILPRHRQGAERGEPVLGWLVYGLLNVGVALVGIGPLVAVSHPPVLLGRMAELAAMTCFFFLMWTRIKAFGR